MSADVKLVSIREATHILSIGRTSLYELIGDGEIATVRIKNRRLVLTASIEAFIERLQLQSGNFR